MEARGGKARIHQIVLGVGVRDVDVINRGEDVFSTIWLQERDRWL